MTMKEDFLKGRHVLIVDDEEDVLQVLEQLLTMCVVAKARTFEEAEALLKTQPFDIAILDIMGVDGYKLLEIANEHKVIGVMLTAHAFSPEHLMQSIKKGAASYVPKERMSEIVTYLNDILEAKALGRHVWFRWHDRLGSLFEARFGPDWKENEKDFWSKFLRAYGTRRV